MVARWRRHTISYGDWSSYVCSSALPGPGAPITALPSTGWIVSVVTPAVVNVPAGSMVVVVVVDPSVCAIVSPLQIGRASCRERALVSVIAEDLVTRYNVSTVLQVPG